MHRARKRFRVEAAVEIKDNFCTTASVVHWDGKLLPNVANGIGVIERLPVLVTSLVDGDSKLLGVPKLPSVTGRLTADAVYDQLQSWECDSEIIGMCFDTTSVNTGIRQGACKFLEDITGKNMLWLACRHHMHEVLLSDVYTLCYGPSSGPEILPFKRFREKWGDINHELSNRVIATPLIAAPIRITEFINEQLGEAHPRNDYLEFLELAALMVGIENVHAVRKPGAIHRARWMAKAIYSLKIELLLEGNESIIKLTGREFLAMQRFNRFVVLVYLESWFTCKSAVDAPVNDVRLIQRLDAYDDAQIRKVGLDMMKRHSWYISPEMATLSLFSYQIGDQEKDQLIANMGSERGNHLLKNLPTSVEELKISQSFFETTGMSCRFLESPAECWQEDICFQNARNSLINLQCVNDCAERGVALIEKFNAATSNEEQKQCLLQVVEKHRKEFHINCNRSDLTNI